MHAYIFLELTYKQVDKINIIKPFDFSNAVEALCKHFVMVFLVNIILFICSEIYNLNSQILRTVIRSSEFIYYKEKL